MIIIGLGTGRSGTQSLSALLDCQHHSRCFHEMNPHSVRFQGTPHPILNTINEFQAIVDGGEPSAVTVNLSAPHTAETYDQLCGMKRIKMIGDVALYYLSYIELIASENDNVRFICLRRDVESTVRSFLEKTRTASWPSKYVADFVHALIIRAPFRPTKNHWKEHDGTIWAKDNVWDKLFPKFDVEQREDAIRMYCEYYYGEAARLSAKLSDRFLFVETEALGDREQQCRILNFVGIDPLQHVYIEAHKNRSTWR